jgi:hypothetical protein
MGIFEASMLAAQDCKCSEAYAYADEGYSNAERGYSSNEVHEIKDYGSDAGNAAYEVVAETENCTDRFPAI